MAEVFAILISIVSGTIAFLSYRAANKSSEAALRSARAAERTAKVQEDEAARKPEVTVQTLYTSPPEVPFAGEAREFWLSLRNEGSVAATRPRGWIRLPAHVFKPVSEQSIDREHHRSGGVVYPTAPFPHGQFWTASFSPMHEHSLPPRGEMLFMVPTQILRTATVVVEVWATCDEKPGEMQCITIDVEGSE